MAVPQNSVEGRTKPYLERIERLLADGEIYKSVYQEECKARRGEIKSVIAEAKDNGIPASALKGLVKYRELERKQTKIADGLKPDEAETYMQLVDTLGPLGMAAAVAAGHAQDRGAVLPHPPTMPG